MDWVDKVEFKEFEFTSNLGTKRYGVIAQDIEKINKDLINEDIYGTKGVSYIDLLIAKVARQDQIINDLIKRIEKLESEK